MGIRGIYTMIRKDSSFQIIDLLNEAEKNSGIEILVDFDAIIRFVMETILLKMTKDYENEYLHFPLGVYDVITEAYTDLHTGFSDAGIRLVWIVDGAKGVDQLASDQKTETWKKRALNDIEIKKKVLSACMDKSSVFERNNVYPFQHIETALLALKNVGAEVIHLLQGQADDYIAYEFRRRKSFAILTNDTDFVIFPDCVVIFHQLLSHCYEDNNLKLPFLDYENPGKIFKRPSHLKCPVVYPENILRLFQFTDHTQLIALSILNGNDSTSTYSLELANHLKVCKYRNAHPSIIDFVNYIRNNSITSENIEQFPAIEEFMRSHPRCGESIRFAKEVYSLRRIEDTMNSSHVLFDPSNNDDSLTSFLAKKLVVGEISRAIYSLHFGKLYDFVAPEEPNRDCPPITTLLSELRRIIYPYILNENIMEVVEWRYRQIEVLEWRSRGDNHLVKVPVEHASLKTNMIKGKSDGERDFQEKYGIDFFEDAICHQEKNGALHYVEKYGIKKAFTCYILRYLYILTKDRNLRVSDKEFRGLFATVFYQFSLSEGVKFNTKMNQADVLRMKICPSKRCLIIASWFMIIFGTAKDIGGAVFNLTKEFPLPVEIMNGPVFSAFYENLMCDKNGRTSHIKGDLIGQLENEVMSMYEEEFGLITDWD